MKKLFLEEAMELHKELWLRMSKIDDYNQFIGQGLYMLKSHCLKNMGYEKESGIPINYCFLCEYADQQMPYTNPKVYRCQYCPVFKKVLKSFNCISYGPYDCLERMFYKDRAHNDFTDDEINLIRESCIIISELKPDEFRVYCEYI